MPMSVAEVYMLALRKSLVPIVGEAVPFPFDGKQYFRIRLGTYRSMEAANDAKAEFEKSSKKSAIVIKL